MGKSFFGCIYYAAQVQLHSSGSPLVHFWGSAGGHLCLLYKSPIYIQSVETWAHGVERQGQKGD